MTRKIAVALIFLILISCAGEKFTIFVPQTMDFAKINFKPRVILVLGGGGSKGVAHLGVLEVLEENNIKVDMIVGSSAGAIVGAFYADKPSTRHIKDIFINMKKNDLVDNISFHYSSIPIILSGATNGDRMRRFLSSNLRSKNFDELKIPLVVVTTDMTTSEAFCINSGPLVPALHASSAVPIVFKPVFLYGKTLADGAIASPVPVSIAKSFSPDIIIAVNITKIPGSEDLESAFDVFSRAFDISYYHFTLKDLEGADIVVNPIIKEVNMFDDSQNDAVYRAGKHATKKILPKLKTLLKKSKKLAKDK